jgi:hypothetical protein
MTQQHPITPPPELVEQWAHLPADWNTVAFLIAQWGADAELDACCEWLSVPCPSYGRELRNARRPKPPSLKEMALDDLDGIAAVFRMSHGGDLICDTIRRALEALPE